MSWYLANEKWIGGHESGLLGQFASGKGYSDFIAAVSATAYPALADLLEQGVSERVTAIQADLRHLAKRAESADVRSVARAMLQLSKNQQFIGITQGCS